MRVFSFIFHTSNTFHKCQKSCVIKSIIMAGAIKKTTGLTGMAVAVNPHYSLGVIYNKILRTLEKMPETANYRKYTEQIINERAGLLKSTPNIIEFEKKVACGQVEELIIQAENELQLARKMLNWKPWEPLTVKAPKGQWEWPPTN